MQSVRDGLAQLEQLASSSSDVGDADLLGQVTDLYFATASQHTNRDIASFGDVMERLAYRLDVDPRAAFADRIADASNASRRLLRRLVSDEIVVAEPVLSRSQSLSERDLEEIAATCDPGHLLALSRRRIVPPDLADVIVMRGDRKALIALAANAGVVLSRRGFTQLLRRAEKIRELREIIDLRGVVGADLVTRLWLRMTGWKAVEKPEECEAGVPEEPATADLPVTDEPTEEAPATDSKARLDALSAGDDEETSAEESALLDAARAYNVPEMVRCLCELTKTDRNTVEHLLLEAELRPLSVFCKAYDIDGTTFAALVGLRVESGKLQASDLVKAMRRYAAMSPSRARELLESIQQQ
ncbi:MAG: DUF2336 domain-containing protein [Methyloligellaceae bacterium]